MATKSGWARKKTAAEYAGVGVRTLRRWMAGKDLPANLEPLEYTKMPSGHVLIKYEAIDRFLEQFTTRPNSQEAEQLADEIIASLA